MWIKLHSTVTLNNNSSIISIHKSFTQTLDLPRTDSDFYYMFFTNFCQWFLRRPRDLFENRQIFDPKRAEPVRSNPDNCHRNLTFNKFAFSGQHFTNWTLIRCRIVQLINGRLNADWANVNLCCLTVPKKKQPRSAILVSKFKINQPVTDHR